MAADDLTIPESILLLALHDESGERKGSFLEYALAGAGLAELLLMGRLREAGDPPKRLDFIDMSPVGEPFLDACIEAISKKKSGKKAVDYVNAMGGKSAPLRILLDQLTRRGVLQMKEKKFLFFFTRKVYPEADPSAENALKQRLATAMFGTGEVDARDSVIIALANSVDILRHNFDRELLKSYKPRIKEISEGSLLPAGAAQEAIEAVRSAIFIAAIMPAIIVTAT